MARGGSWAGSGSPAPAPLPLPLPAPPPGAPALERRTPGTCLFLFVRFSPSAVEVRPTWPGRGTQAAAASEAGTRSWPGASLSSPEQGADSSPPWAGESLGEKPWSLRGTREHLPVSAP